MEYPEETITVGAKGKREARVLRSRGTDYIVYGYVELETGKTLAKYSILLRKNGKELEHMIIVPTTGGKELVVKHEIEEKSERRGIYDEKTTRVIYF